MKIICIGDSLTYGFGVSMNKSWYSRLKAQYKSFDIINKGINGDTTAGILSRFAKDALNLKPNLCIIMAGTNDFLLGRTADSVVDNISMMIEDCIHNNISPVILVQPLIVEDLAKIHWSSYIDYINTNDSLVSFRKLILELCIEKSVTSIDIQNLFLTLAKDNSRDYFIDGVHPTELGHKVIFEKIVDYFSSIRIK